MTAAVVLSREALADAIIRTQREQDSYTRAALNILTAGCGWNFIREPRIWRNVEVYRSTADNQNRIAVFDFEAMLAEDGWTPSELAMVRAAAHLFNQAVPFNLDETFYVDPINFDVLLSAIHDRRYQRPWTDGHEALVWEHLSAPEPAVAR